MEILRRTKDVNLYYDIPMQRESYITEMLQNNTFRTILPVSMMRTDEDCVLSFRADGMQSFARRFGVEAPDWKRVKTLVRNIADCIREMQEYMLPPEGVVLSAAYIFQETGNGGYRFLYSTVPEKSFAASMKQLFEEIMPEFSHENREDVIAFYELYGKFLDEQFTPAMLLQVVEDWDRGLNGRSRGDMNRLQDHEGNREAMDWFQDNGGNRENMNRLSDHGGNRKAMNRFSDHDGNRKAMDWLPDHAGKRKDDMTGADMFRTPVGTGTSRKTFLPQSTAYDRPRVRMKKDVKEPAIPAWLIITGVVAVLAGAAVYLIFGKTAIKGIALLGVVYVVLIILYLHSREKDDNKTKHSNIKTKDNTSVSTVGDRDIYGPEKAETACDRKKAFGSDANRLRLDIRNTVRRDEGWNNLDWNNADNTDNKVNVENKVNADNRANVDNKVNIDNRNNADNRVNSDKAVSESLLWAAEHSHYDTPSRAASSVYEETDVLCAPPVPLTRLVPTENAERMPITLNKGVCRIGRTPDDNEYCIPSPRISRAHARISCGEGTVLLQDMHSTNGTYVNNERIREDDTKELHYGDVVSFAGEEYYCV